MTSHLPNCHHKDGRHLITKPDGEIIATCRCICTCPKEEIKIVPSPRIDWCGACKAEHGYDCPKDTPPSSTEWEKEFDKRWGCDCDENTIPDHTPSTLCRGAWMTDEIKSFIKGLLSTSIKNREREIAGLLKKYKCGEHKKLLASLSQEDEK